jgi:hypothetical protein
MTRTADKRGHKEPLPKWLFLLFIFPWRKSELNVDMTVVKVRFGGLYFIKGVFVLLLFYQDGSSY